MAHHSGRFADAVAGVMQEDSDYVWVHDYHLMYALVIDRYTPSAVACELSCGPRPNIRTDTAHMLLVDACLRVGARLTTTSCTFHTFYAVY